MLATWREVVISAPLAVFCGFVAGFVVGARYRISKRNGD